MTKENDFSAHNEWGATKVEVKDDSDMLCNARKPLDLNDKEKPSAPKLGNLNDSSTWSLV